MTVPTCFRCGESVRDWCVPPAPFASGHVGLCRKCWTSNLALESTGCETGCRVRARGLQPRHGSVIAIAGLFASLAVLGWLAFGVWVWVHTP